MADDPRVSILLPTHNRAEVLEYAIRSVLAQTLTDFEILLVGDGCTDNTSEVVASFADPRIRWFDLPKAPGFGYANRNIALAEARGELVAFMGHDNLVFRDHLEVLVRLFEDENAHFAYSRPLWVRDDGLVVPFFVNLTIPSHCAAFLDRHNVLPATCIMHRRKAFAAIGAWPEDVAGSGDHDLWRRIIGHHGPGSIRHSRDPTCLHFRANWRDPEHWGPPPLAYLSGIHEGGFWPPHLFLGVKPGQGTPQAQVWRMMEMDGGAFARKLRLAAAQAQDLIAWMAYVLGPDTG